MMLEKVFSSIEKVPTVSNNIRLKISRKYVNIENFFH